MSTEKQKEAARQNIEKARAAAERYDVEVSESDWRELFKSGKAPKR
jgi:hypothetical protein